MSTSGSPPPPLNDPSAPLDPTSSTSALPSQPEPSTLTTSSSKSVKSSKDKGKKKAPSAGIVYISRIPPGMTPQKIKHLMGRWGDVGKVYAQKDDASAGKKGKNAKAWIEFLNKSVAKSAAEMLNAQPIGGAKGEKWRDDIWTMKYLPGFKWEMLGEQVAYERASHTSRLRQELSRSKAEQSEYLRNVELARVLEKRKEKKAAAAAVVGRGGSAQLSETTGGATEGESKGKRKYDQRGAEGEGQRPRKQKKKTAGGQDGEAKLVGVLDSLF